MQYLQYLNFFSFSFDSVSDCSRYRIVFSRLRRQNLHHLKDPKTLPLLQQKGPTRHQGKHTNSSFNQYSLSQAHFNNVGPPAEYGNDHQDMSNFGRDRKFLFLGVRKTSKECLCWLFFTGFVCFFVFQTGTRQLLRRIVVKTTSRVIKSSLRPDFGLTCNGILLFILFSFSLPC